VLLEYVIIFAGEKSGLALPQKPEPAPTRFASRTIPEKNVSAEMLIE
jgi:hypothetical protein